MDWLAEECPEKIRPNKGSWKVVIVDDDDEIHKVTKLSLSEFEFEGKSLELISVYSGVEAKKLFANCDDIAMVLLDVVMESESAGFDVVKYIREDLGNHFTRIVLRTGQPGFAPINDVIRDFDIDGYLAKTEITKHTLNHNFYTSLRSYRDVLRIQKYQKGLEAVINAIANLTQIDEVLTLAQAVMSQLSSVLCAEQAEFVIQGSDIFTLTKSVNKTCQIVIDEHQAKILTNGPISNETNLFIRLSEKALEQKQCISEPPYYINYYSSLRGTETIFILKSSQALNKDSEKLLHAFSVHVVLTLENLLLHK